ncbi:leucine--tRNA ligase, partial [Candidatus Parcubacteria bacterium]|nr:leucine--tRNA ligase [Candidatus Parcubacteria bacterium]
MTEQISHKSGKYNPQTIEPKWQKAWREARVFQPDLRRAPKPFYNLMMFPYPSGEGLHVGNMYAFTGSDIYGRFKRMQGFDVFEPIGLDGFGIHSENYAIKLGEHPTEVAKRTEKNFYRQLEAAGNAYAWENTLETYDPGYYQWTQWIFTQFYKAGLVERKKSPVNWCPSCKTSLSDEQVVSGECERCGTEVEKRELAQWFFKITKYADRLLENLEWINWSERTKTAQRNWIGKSEGTEIKFRAVGGKTEVPVFTTRPDTLFGATFFVIAPESGWVNKLTPPANKKEVDAYVKRSRKKTEIQRLFTEREKTGVFTGAHVINPATNKKIPVWVADYVVLGYGTGAVMGVPAHDQRDWEFAKERDLPIVPVISGGNVGRGAWDGAGKLINSSQFDGLPVEEGIEKITVWLEKEGVGKKQVQYRLRDWCISRQRYWGPPIPMIYCEDCARKGVGERKEMPGWFTVDEGELPVELPLLDNYQPQGLGDSPLAQVKEWVTTKCPQCGGEAERETDVSDTFLDSAWYFFRYPSTRSARSGQVPFDPGLTKKWLPVDMYIGGQEHACLHLMYTRFLTMAFRDLGLIEFEEPFKRFYAHGLIISEGVKMSKSRGNVVIPDEYIKKYGADTLRCYLMFLGPFDQGGDFRGQGVGGMRRFLNRVWRLADRVGDCHLEDGEHRSLERLVHRTIKKVGGDIEELKYNTAIAAMMELVNELTACQSVPREALEYLVLLLAPFAPFLAEELYQRLRAGSTKYPARIASEAWRARQVPSTKNSEFDSVHSQPWPEYNPELVKEEMITIVVQVNGKVRDKLKLKGQPIDSAQGRSSKLKSG